MAWAGLADTIGYSTANCSGVATVSSLRSFAMSLAAKSAKALAALSRWPSSLRIGKDPLEIASNRARIGRSASQRAAETRIGKNELLSRQIFKSCPFHDAASDSGT